MSTTTSQPASVPRELGAGESILRRTVMLTGNPFDPLRDGLTGAAGELIVAAGGWFESNTGGAQVAFSLDDGAPIGFNNPRLSNSHRFFGVIETTGFYKFEVYETEGTVQDQKFIFADDFILSPQNAVVYFSGAITGVVTDSATGAAIEGVRVSIYDSTGPLATTTYTDAWGQYATGLLPAGTYFAATSNNFGYAGRAIRRHPVQWM